MVSTYHVGELVKAIAGDDITLDYMSQDNIPVCTITNPLRRTFSV